MILLSRSVFTLASFVLMALAVLLIVHGAGKVALALIRFEQLAPRIFEGIEYVIISVAVFDVAKFLLEDNVVQDRAMRQASEARESLTRFVSTIATAVFLEALVAIFEVGKEDPSKLLYPTLLLLAGICLVLGLGMYQRLSASVEREVEPDAP